MGCYLMVCMGFDFKLRLDATIQATRLAAYLGTDGFTSSLRIALHVDIAWEIGSEECAPARYRDRKKTNGRSSMKGLLFVTSSV